MVLEDDVHHGTLATNRNSEVVSSVNQIFYHDRLASIEESLAGPGEMCAVENNFDNVVLKNKTDLGTSHIEQESISSHGLRIDDHDVRMDEDTDVPGDVGVITSCQSDVAFNKLQLTANRNPTKHVVSAAVQLEKINQPTCPSAKQQSNVLNVIVADTNKLKTSDIKNIEELTCNFDTRGESENISSLEASGVSTDGCVRGTLTGDVVSHKILQQKSLSTTLNAMELSSGTDALSKEFTVSIQQRSSDQGETSGTNDQHEAHESMSDDNVEQEITKFNSPDIEKIETNQGKRKRKVDWIRKLNDDCHGFIRSPCEGLRPRAGKGATSSHDSNTATNTNKDFILRRARRGTDIEVPVKNKDKSGGSHKCDLEGCSMSFKTKTELAMHKRNICPYEGCGKRFNSHKYALVHQRVHDDERPLKCPWKGCSMSFKWAWARTEHMRVHTGEKPYKCKVEGCGRSFRFVSDYSRHRRKTGHYIDSPS